MHWPFSEIERICNIPEGDLMLNPVFNVCHYNSWNVRVFIATWDSDYSTLHCTNKSLIYAWQLVLQHVQYSVHCMSHVYSTFLNMVWMIWWWNWHSCTCTFTSYCAWTIFRNLHLCSKAVSYFSSHTVKREIIYVLIKKLINLSIYHWIHYKIFI